jgi:hypothetical protein
MPAPLLHLKFRFVVAVAGLVGSFDDAEPATPTSDPDPVVTTGRGACFQLLAFVVYELVVVTAMSGTEEVAVESSTNPLAMGCDDDGCFWSIVVLKQSARRKQGIWGEQLDSSTSSETEPPENVVAFHLGRTSE